MSIIPPSTAEVPNPERRGPSRWLLASFVVGVILFLILCWFFLGISQQQSGIASTTAGEGCSNSLTLGEIHLDATAPYHC